MSQPTSVTPLAEPPVRAPSALPVGPVLPPAPPARRGRRAPLLVAALLVVLGLGAVGVRLAADVGQDAAVAGADARVLAGGLPAGSAAPYTQPSPGLPPSAVPPPSAVLPPATQPPTGLGSDPALDADARACATGDMTACVQLYLSSYRDPALQRYTAYGDTCAGRQPAATLRLCTAAFPR